MSESDPSPDFPLKLEIYTDLRADGWYAVSLFPEEANKEPVEVGPFATEVEADEAWWRMMEVVKSHFGDRIDSIRVREHK